MKLILTDKYKLQIEQGMKNRSGKRADGKHVAFPHVG